MKLKKNQTKISEDLKVQLEEAKKIEVIKDQPKAKESDCEKLALEVVSLRKKLEKSFEKLSVHLL